MLHAVIMAGGSGTRFWPQSRQQTPKQLLRLAGDRTMIQQTVDRCRAWVPRENVWIVTNHLQLPRTTAQLPEVPARNILAEPAARNTAPCVGLAAIQVLREDPEGIMFVMPADHVIRPESAFADAARQAVEIVQRDPQQLVLFGVTPTFPATGYGYIERGRMLSDGSPPVFEVAAFREKPCQATAEEYLRAGRFYWNCGIFCWKARTILDLLASFEPELHERLLRIAAGQIAGNSEEVLQREFPQMKSISIDYAVLERASRVTVIEAPFAWDDVGSWLAVPRLNGTDADGNAVDGRFCGVDTQGCIVRSSGDHLVATLGVRNLIIVHTPDATLVADAGQSEQIREILSRLNDQGLTAWL